MAVMIPYSGNLTSFVLCRMVARMNLTHTVGDIRNFINACVRLFFSPFFFLFLLASNLMFCDFIFVVTVVG